MTSYTNQLRSDNSPIDCLIVHLKMLLKFSKTDFKNAIRCLPNSLLFLMLHHVDLDVLEHNYEFECDTCDWYVAPKTKHWKVWNRWTKEFDHHWIWLNNCIGYNNYRYFFILLVVYMFYNFYYLIVGSYWVLTMVDEHVNTHLMVGVSITLLILLLKVIITLGATLLLLFHILLWFRGISTYEFIVQRRARKE